MKAVYAVLMGALVLGLFANCAKKDNPAQGTNEMAATCYMMQTQGNPYAGGAGCNGQAYNAQGFSPVVNNGQMNGQMNNGFAGFQQGGISNITCAAQFQMPTLVYSASKGLGCVDATYINTSGTPAIYTLNPQGGYFTLAPQGYNGQQGYAQPGYGQPGYGYQQPYGGAYGATGQTVYRSCDQSDVCPQNLYCRSPFGPGNTGSLGLCYY